MGSIILHFQSSVVLYYPCHVVLTLLLVTRDCLRDTLQSTFIAVQTNVTSCKQTLEYFRRPSSVSRRLHFSSFTPAFSRLVVNTTQTQLLFLYYPCPHQGRHAADCQCSLAASHPRCSLGSSSCSTPVFTRGLFDLIRVLEQLEQDYIDN